MIKAKLVLPELINGPRGDPLRLVAPACVGTPGWVIGWDDDARRLRYTGYRFPAEIIRHAIWLYLRFPLGLRMVKELLAARGHATVRPWTLKVGQPFAHPS